MVDFALVQLWPESHRLEKHLFFKFRRGFSEFIWDKFSGRYLDQKNWALLDNKNDLWSLIGDRRLSISYRCVLAMTLDYAYIKQDAYKRAAKDILEFLSDFGILREESCSVMGASQTDFLEKIIDIALIGEKPKGNTNHWYRIADALEAGIDSPAIGFLDDDSDWNWDKAISIYG